MRLDVALLERGLVSSRESAKKLILSGVVCRNGLVLQKPNAPVGQSDVLEVTQQPRYVSRGGLKLEAALDYFQIDPTGKTCLDIGASTGGFTDCLLQHGARRVYAFDSGSAQLVEKLKNDERVVSRENFNVRYLQPEDISDEILLVVIDVSFISLTLILPSVARVLEKGDVIALIKPQFEVGRENVGKGGIVRDERLRQNAVEKIKNCALESGFDWRGVMDSPIEGGDGNREFLCWLEK
ncbi:MAG TPA: TlyA family RNA methyltransferase [Abditibacteriaceae bacterium]